MIGRLTGLLLEKNPPQILLDVQGVAYEVDVPMSTFYNLPALNEKVVLHTHLVVREDAHLLFGFGSLDERTAFRQLLKISGVGPRLALAIVSTLSVAQLQNAIAREEPEILTRVPGIGKKLAQRLALELKDKLAIEPATGLAAISDIDTDVLAALTALGYSVVEAQSALQAIPRDAPQDVETRVLLALQYFG